jgi:adenylate cyclase
VYKDTCSRVELSANVARVPEFPVLDNPYLQRQRQRQRRLLLGSGLVSFRDGFRFSGIPSKSPIIGPAFHTISTTIFHRPGLARQTRTRCPFFGSFPLLCLTFPSACHSPVFSRSLQPTPPAKSPRSFGFGSKMPSFSPPRNQSGRSARSTDSNSAEDHASFTGSSTSNGHRGLRKPKSFMNPLNVIRRARSKARLDADDRDAQAASKAQPLLPAFVSSGSGDSSFLQMDPTSGKNGLRARGREKKKSKGSTAAPVQSALQPEFNIDLNLERMEGIIDPSVLQSTHSGSISGATLDVASTSGPRTDGRAATPSSSSSSQPHLGGPVFSDPFVSRPSSVRSREGEGTIDLRRMSPHTITPAVLPPQLMSHPSGSQDGNAPWKPPPSWVTGDQPEPDVSSSEDEKASATKRKSRRRATVTRASQSHGMDIRNFKIRVYRANNEFHILTCSLATTVGQLSGKLNAKLLSPGEREDHRLYLKERGRGPLGYSDPFRNALKRIYRAYACSD